MLKDIYVTYVPFETACATGSLFGFVCVCLCIYLLDTIIMDTIIMDTIITNCKTSDPHRLLLSLTDKINLKRNDKYIALSNHI